jgi:hypothetical protein
MNDLLQVAVDAHGGLSRSNQLKRVRANPSITGVIWQMKGKPAVLEDVSIEADLHNDVSAHTHVNYECGRLSGPRFELPCPLNWCIGQAQWRILARSGGTNEGLLSRRR